MSTTNSLQEHVAEEVRALLARRRLSARRVALALSWTEIYMYRRLRNETAFDLNDLQVLAAHLDVPVTAFFEGLDRDAALSRSVPASREKAYYLYSSPSSRMSDAA